MQDKIVFTGDSGNGTKDSVQFKKRKRLFKEVLMNIVHYTELKMKICRETKYLFSNGRIDDSGEWTSWNSPKF
jgi:hypothetical protein